MAAYHVVWECVVAVSVARCASYDAHLATAPQYITSYRLNMFRTLLCPSSGARDYDFDYHIGRFVLGLLYVGV